MSGRERIERESIGRADRKSAADINSVEVGGQVDEVADGDCAIEIQVANARGTDEHIVIAVSIDKLCDANSGASVQAGIVDTLAVDPGILDGRGQSGFGAIH